jgi:Fur family ferric uptake transcriptional regulator
MAALAFAFKKRYNKKTILQRAEPIFGEPAGKACPDTGGGSLDDIKKETRNTKQKRLIIECLEKNRNSHLSAEEIYNLIRQGDQQISIATVYRNLRLLEEQGVIRKIFVSEDALAFYELSENNVPHSHHHLICRRCGKIIDFEEDLLEAVEKMIEVTEGFFIEDHRVVFYGVCRECRQKDADGTAE